jgi:hypothetical protein
MSLTYTQTLDLLDLSPLQIPYSGLFLVPLISAPTEVIFVPTNKIPKQPWSIQGQLISLAD